MRAITALFFLFCFLVPSALAQLRLGFYQSSCPLAEKIVNSVVSNEFLRSRNNPNITAALLRMQFHDCFVNGCDASLLIDSTPERPSEKSAKPNASLRDFEIIDRIKEMVEQACPQTVSCADILTLATRDAVALAGGPGFSVLTGRRDGLRSNPSDVIDNLSRPTISVAESIKLFGAKGLGVEDMTALIGGGHSVGFTHCSQFKDRLNDPEMNPVLKARLRNTCSASDDPTVFLDQSTPFLVDNGLYKEIRSQRGTLRIDQNLGLHRSTSEFVSTFAKNDAVFSQRFAQAMMKMGSIGVLTGDAGEIRTSCRVFNN